MRLTTNRTKFDTQLGDGDLTLLLLVGATDSQAGSVHDFFENRNWEPWRICWLISDTSVLTAAELDSWFDNESDDRYAVVGGAPLKAVAIKGSIDKLLRADGQPSVLKIRSGFAKGDQL